MAKTIPMIVTNNSILVKDRDGEGFKPFNLPSLNPLPNIPFYHEYAEKIAESQYYFKEFMKVTAKSSVNIYWQSLFPMTPQSWSQFF